MIKLWIHLAPIAVFIYANVHAQEMPFAGSPGKTSLASEISVTGGDDPVTETRAQASVPLHKGEKTIWSAIGRGNSVALGDTSRINDRQFDVPKHFGSAEVGVAAHFPRADVTRSFNVLVGTSGRKLMDAENARSISAMYLSEWKSSPTHAWYFSVSYSNNRTSFNNIPLPGIAYGYQTERLRFVAGFPFVFVMWMPKPWTLTSFLSPFGATGDVAYEIHGPWSLATNISWQPRAYQNLAPNVDGERLIFDKKELAIGPRATFGPLASFSLAYVYDFDREIFIGKSTLENRSDTVALKDAGGVQLKMRATF